MPARQPVPTLWLMTDERADAGLERALERLPRGAGIVFRHRATARPERRARYEAVRRIARRRGLVLILAGDPRDALGWRADGWHGRGPRRLPRHLLRTAPAHDIAELATARRAGADAAFVSPIFPTRSHPGTPTLGIVGFGRLASPRGSSGLLSRSNRSECPPVLLRKRERWRYEPSRNLLRSGLRRSTDGEDGTGRPLLIALGGMTPRRFRGLKPLGADGWAAIDAWNG